MDVDPDVATQFLEEAQPASPVAAVMNPLVAILSSAGLMGTYKWLQVASLGLLGVASSEARTFVLLHHAWWCFPITLAGRIAFGVRAPLRVVRVRAARVPAGAVE